MEETFLHSMESIPLETIVRNEYRLYQIYTLMDRAIPYLEDGLKPVQRRILYTLFKNQNKGLMKVSSATGLVLTLHPHGPVSIESSIVNMAQDFAFSNNYPLIDKKGYFGERMENQAAASRYIECKVGEVSKLLLFDDLNQVEMVPNYDEKVMEPSHLLPKLPLMLLNGSEGIGTGFSSVIPSFHHKDIVASMISFIQTGKAKKLKPWVRYYNGSIEMDRSGRIVYSMTFEEKGGKIFVTELPRGFDSKKTNRYLSKFIESDYLKDFIDSTVDNEVNIELLFKRGKQPDLASVEKKIKGTSSQVSNYTLISERGVKIFNRPEQIIEIFAGRRIEVVKIRYELLARDCAERIKQNNEIIRFIKQRHYAQAEKKANRKAFVDYLSSKKFIYAEYLADMAIYRMTKEEVSKRSLMVKEDTSKLKEYQKVAKSKVLVKKKLIEELKEVDTKLTEIFKKIDKIKKDSVAKTVKFGQKKKNARNKRN